jgi:hypothetical protein
MANVQVAVGFWWEAGHDLLMTLLAQVVFNDVADKIATAWWRVHGHRFWVLLAGVLGWPALWHSQRAGVSARPHYCWDGYLNGSADGNLAELRTMVDFA